jgi:hypothetical protein
VANVARLPKLVRTVELICPYFIADCCCRLAEAALENGMCRVSR